MLQTPDPIRRIPFALLALMLLVAPAPAQDEPPPAADPGKRYRALQEYLDRDLFVREGVGLKRVRLGQPFDSALKAWGNPRRRVDRGLLERERQWYYRADRDTEILIAGGERIERMVFRGASSSLYQSVAGARFGMPPYQVSSLYGRAGQAGSGQGAETLDYPDRGIRFYFEQGALRGFEVYRPER